MGIQIDIGAKVYGLDDYVYRLFPGEGYCHFAAMKDNSIVFLDYPGIGLPGLEGYEETREWLERLVRSERKSSVLWARNPNMMAELAEVEDTDLGEVRWSQRRRQALSWLNRLHCDVWRGDLIVIPGPGYAKTPDGEWVEERTRIGEIAGAPFIINRDTELDLPDSVRFGEYVARRVKWLGEVDERELPVHFRAPLRTQNPLITLRAGPIAHIIGAAHHNLIMGDEFHARFVTDNPDFSAFESFQFSAFALAVVAVCKRMESGEVSLDPEDSIYDLAASVAQGDELVPVQETSIRSPGYITLRGGRLVPALIAILFQLAIATAKAEADPFAGPGLSQVTVANSKSEAFDPDAEGLNEAANALLDMMGRTRWQELCRAATVCSENDGLASPSTRVTIAPELGN